MESIVINIAITLVVVLSFLFGEALPLILPYKSRHFNCKPFNCRPCLTFWLHLIGMLIIAQISQYLIIAISGVVTAFIVFAIVWDVERRKILP